MNTTEMSHAVYLDANIFILAVEAEAAISQPISDWFDELRRRRVAIWTSEITLAEVLGKGSTADELRQLYLQFIVSSGICSLAPVSREILMATADLRRGRNYKLPDAIHIVSALQTDCRYFVSADRRLSQLPGALSRVDPDPESLATFLSTLNA